MYSYNRLEPQRHQPTRRSALGYWVPLVVTVTIATAGLAAWIWSERRDDESDDDDRRRGPISSQGSMPDFNAQRSSQMAGAPREEEGVFTRVSRGLRRTPSPQNILDGVVAGVAAAGAAVGGVLSSIREEDRRDFEDHSRWSEEAKSRNVNIQPQEKNGLSFTPTAPSSSSRPSTYSGVKESAKRKTVAIVISAHTEYHSPEEVTHHEENAVSPGSKFELHRVSLKSQNSLYYHTSLSMWTLTREFLSLSTPLISNNTLSIPMYNPQDLRTLSPRRTPTLVMRTPRAAGMNTKGLCHWLIQTQCPLLHNQRCFKVSTNRHRH